MGEFLFYCNEWWWTSIPTIRAGRLGELSVPKPKLTEMRSSRGEAVWGGAAILAQLALAARVLAPQPFGDLSRGQGPQSHWLFSPR